ncbi:MAG: PIG-L domain-containing protein [Pyrinomonadaceae bacterium]|jgi:LmbE family N-acetylglucosaminyl deacetylase|nr:MAG: PIG-L domain-containing protein [Pyrinomonadaceae bacterium]
MKFKRAFVFVFFALFVLQAKSQVRPVYDGGALGLGQILKRLQTTASALHVGAHPDDEDSALLAYLARKEQARTAYLSLNRGEGGQNVIGPEIFEPLGIIRTEELLQARKLDGAEQFFTRVMDFGFSKTLTESARIWNERLVLEDMVRVIRIYRPLVIISRFTGTPADGHGHHQLAGYLTPIAFKAAADPNQFPEQLKQGLKPWQAKKLYVSEGFLPNPQNRPTLLLNTGEYDFLLGRSYYEIAIEGRSQHKSQEMGALELRGKQTSGVRLLESLVPTNAEKETSVFDGIDTSLAGIARLFGEENASLEAKLAELQKVAEKALENFDPLNPEQLVPILAEGFKLTQEAQRLTENYDIKRILKQKESEFAKALMLASGVVVDALSDNETPTPGSSILVAVRIFAPEKTKIEIGEVSLKLPQGWRAEKVNSITPIQETALSIQRERATFSAFFRVSIPKTAKLTQPFWLEKPRENFAFVWDEEELKSLPFAPPLIVAKGELGIAGVKIPFEKGAEYRYADAVRGEIRRNINVVPRISVAVDSEFIILPTSNEKSEQEIKVSVTNNDQNGAVKGTLKLLLPEGWISLPDSVDFQFKSKGEKASFAFKITIPQGVQGDYRVLAQVVSDGEVFDQTMHTVSYLHIQTHRYYRKAQTEIKIFDLKVEKVNVGYVMGSGDKVAEAIKRLGLNVTFLEEKDLSTGDLSKFDVIVVGIRASQVRPDFVANNNRLLDYVKAGGVLIVQYQQSDYVRQNLTPFPAKMDAVTVGNQRFSNLRVTDENAPVKILVPDHPIFNFPNKITDEDWKGWIQERNLYCFTEFDPRYIPLLESHDEGEPENKGGMLYAEIGKGKYIYTAYSWFRQLPAGNKGAYRIFANMLSLPRAK